MEITNEEKAKEIAENQFSWYSEFDDVTSYEECYESALEAMQWKDKQHEQEKQQWIDNACEWLFKNTRFTTNDIRDFKNAMKNG